MNLIQINYTWLLKALLTLGFLFGLIVTIILSGQRISHAANNDPAHITEPQYVSGVTGFKDQRDADVYPAIAFDGVTNRYLAVWVTPRHANSESDGFDIYGIFLDASGQPIGNAFRISDNNSVARNGLPAIAAGDGEFVVAWARRGSSCAVYTQRVTDSSNQADKLLASGSVHHHSPHLTYDATRQRYLLIYVQGDDYLPPTLFGAATADCGNNAASTSNVKSVAFHFQSNQPIIDGTSTISSANGGAFRPRVAYSSSLDGYLITWEDRRNSTGQYKFDVFAQRVNGNAIPVGNNFALATGGDYTNYDTTATWTPRPVVAGGKTHFLVSWFTREVQGNAILWSVTGRLISSNGSLGTPFTIAKMTFAAPHNGQSPSGFLSIAFSESVQEYLVGLSTYMESIWGYLSFALVQRVNTNGNLLKLDGSLQNSPGVGYTLDSAIDDRVGISIASHSYGTSPAVDYTVLYSKHAQSGPSQDFDIWSAQVKIGSNRSFKTYLPLMSKK